MASSKHLTLSTHLDALLPGDSRSSLRQDVLPTLLGSIKTIAQALSSSLHVSQVGSANAFGDNQLNVDLETENIIRSAIKQCASIITASSEESSFEEKVNHHSPSASAKSTEKYTVAFDPLDGSSIIAPNWTVGTIIGIWDGETALNQNPDEKQVAAILGILGPRTTAMVALRIPGLEQTCFEVGLNDGNGCFEVIRPSIHLSPPSPNNKGFTRYFAPANLRTAAQDEKYRDLINHFIVEQYTLRYSGGLVPDIAHALVKGHGVFICPVTKESGPKLRRLYELAPIALIVECVGGSAIDPGSGKRILETPIADVNEKSGLICGTSVEVEMVKEKLGI